MRRILISLLWITLAGCQAENENTELPAQPASAVIATVNGVDIYESDIDAEIAELPDALYQFRNDPQARGKILHSLIRNEAISQQARAQGLELDPAIRKRVHDARRQILIEAAKEWQLANMEAISPASVEAYYKAHKQDFTLPEQAHARHILVSTKKQALEIIRKLKMEQADFSALAANESLDDSNRARDGDLNWFPRGVMVEAFDDAVFSMQVGELSMPVKTRFGWHVIELLGRRESLQKPMDEVRGEITAILRQQQLEQWYQQVEKSARIKILNPEYTAK